MSDVSMPNATLIDNLRAEWASIDALLSRLGTEQWSLPSVLPGWTVQDIVAHLIGTESILAGVRAPEVDIGDAAHVHNELGTVNEAWVQAFRDEPPARVHERFRRITGDRLDALAGMAQADFDAPAQTPVGQSTYAHFMQIRLFDCWMHEQDIRDTVGVPGHESGPCPEAAVDQMVRALGYIVGKRAGAPHGSSVTIELTGPVRRSVHVQVAERAHVVDELPGPATTRIKLPSGLFTRLAGGRVDPDEHVERIASDGDADLAATITRNLAHTI